MTIDTTKIQEINSFYRVESPKEVYGIIWVLVPILTLVLGITIGILVIIWLDIEISTGPQQCIGPKYADPQHTHTHTHRREPIREQVNLVYVKLSDCNFF
jgi:hypothetical protein